MIAAHGCRAANCRAMLYRVGAPVTRANCLRLAQQYEVAYRRWRQSPRPPAQEHLRGAILTARAFYSLARHAAN